MNVLLKRGANHVLFFSNLQLSEGKKQKTKTNKQTKNKTNKPKKKIKINTTTASKK